VPGERETTATDLGAVADESAAGDNEPRHRAREVNRPTALQSFNQSKSITKNPPAVLAMRQQTSAAWLRSKVQLTTWMALLAEPRETADNSSRTQH
jgi:hypothetical protein